MVHETFTAIGCLGDVLTGNTKRSRERWKQYAEESVIGSGIYAAHEYLKGDTEHAWELGKGMAMATGKALFNAWFIGAGEFVTS